MLQDVASLEILLVAGFLEGEILRKGPGAVAQVQAGENDLGRSTDRPQNGRRQGSRPGNASPESGTDSRSGARLVEPEDSEGAQLLGRERIGRAGIAPSHGPDVLG